MIWGIREKLWLLGGCRIYYKLSPQSSFEQSERCGMHVYLIRFVGKPDLETRT